MPFVWSEGQVAVRAVAAAQTPALHSAFLEPADAGALDPTFGEAPQSDIAELVERSVAQKLATTTYHFYPGISDRA